PRTPDGKSDLSGIWQVVRSPADSILLSIVGGAKPPANPPQIPKVSLDDVAPASFTDNGAAFIGGLPLKPRAAELVKKRMEDNSKDNPEAHCLPAGIMQYHNIPLPRRIVQTPGLILIVYEANSGLRQIFTDGRTLPKNPEPWWYGYSVGRW